MSTADRVVVQACGCIAVPEAAAALGIAPGAVLSVQSDAERRSITFTLLTEAVHQLAPPLAACSLD